MASPQGVGYGIVVGAVDVLIWRHFVPNVADIRTAPAHDTDLEKAERLALLAGAGFTLLVAGFAKSAEVFAIGGAVLVALDFATKHANAVNPNSGKVEGMESATATTYPMPDYGA